jgi:nucleoside-diphosphate-sugar epimerase
VKVIVVGGSGHIGSFLVPRLVRAGHEVVNVSRGSRASYVQDESWSEVEQVIADRQAEDGAGTFAERLRALRPDVVIDLICFTLGSATALVEGLRGEIGHLVHCGSIWRYGPSARLPITETDGTPPEGEYGIQKDAIARMLEDETRSGGLVTTSLHPGHISGPGWPPIGPLGNLDPAVWWALSAGEELAVPGIGTESMHHVHADDVAQAFQLAVEHRDRAAGEAFNVTAATAMTVRGLASAAAGWFGQEARLRPVSWAEFGTITDESDADTSWQHLWRNHCVSIDKARTRLGYAPAYGPDEAVLDAVRWLIDHERLRVARPLVV